MTGFDAARDVDLMALYRALKQHCRTCGALPGEECQSQSRHHGVIHAARRHSSPGDAGAVAATGSAPAIPPGRATSRMAERLSEQHPANVSVFPVQSIAETTEG